MKDVISVDKILAGVFLEGAEVPQTDNPDKDLDVYIERSGYHIPIAQAKLHSLLISKLPEKKPLITDEPLDAMDEGEKFCVECGQWEYEDVLDCKCVGYNSAIDEMHRVIDEMFGGVSNGNSN